MKVELREQSLVAEVNTLMARCDRPWAAVAATTRARLLETLLDTLAPTVSRELEAAE